jgi:putative (di)nucleoside polyphosphate hydrolase
LTQGESPEEAALRELEEETGVSRDLVQIEAENEGWLAYDLPLDLLDKLWGGQYRGQEQKWFRMRFLGSDDQVNIETDHPEFAEWKWIDQSEMVDAIVPFQTGCLYRGFGPDWDCKTLDIIDIKIAQCLAL